MKCCRAKEFLFLFSFVAMLALCARPAAAAAPAVCGDGVMTGGEQCEAAEPGGPLPACCDPSTCKYRAKNAHYVCRAGSGDICDPEEVCPGKTAECPEDVVASPETVCREAVDRCDVDETCTGVAGEACPADELKDCSDGNECTDDSCDLETGDCLNVDNTDPCDDGSECTTNDTCDAGACVGGPAPDCDDGNVCTDDSCNPSTPGGCEHVDNTAPCNDGDECTTNDTCDAGVCVGGPAPDCDDGNVCTDDSCNPSTPGGCEHADNEDSCDDGLFCTNGDVCSAGACVGGPETTCDDGNVCTADVCEEADQSCTHEDNGVCGTRLRDYTGDLVDDVVMRNVNTGAMRLFAFQNGFSVTNAGLAVPNSGDVDWQVVAEGDFNGDALTDLLMRRVSNGKWQVGLTNGFNPVTVQTMAVYASLDWELAGVGDINDDWTEDIVLRNKLDGAGRVFYVENGAVVSNEATALTSQLNWQVVGMGDFDGNGTGELVQRHVTNGGMRIVYVLPGVVPAVLSTLALPADPTLSVACVADLDGDGVDDILQRRSTDNASFVVKMLAGVAISVHEVALDPTLSVERCADYNGDGVDDVLVRDGTSGESTVYGFVDGEPASTSGAGIYKNLAWQVQP